MSGGVFSGTVQDVFTSNGQTKFLNIREGVDWIEVYNNTVAAANQTTAVAVKFRWQKGYPQNSMWVTYKSNAANAANLEQFVTTGGFALFDNTVNTPGASLSLSAISNAAVPVVSSANTGSLANGNIVRLFNVTGAQQLGGLDFTVGAVSANTSFTLAYMRQIAAATTGTYRIIPYVPYMYPSNRIISKIAATTVNGAQAALITMTVTHAYTVGQAVRFVIPEVAGSSTYFGMTELNGLQGSILAIGTADANGVTNTITVDIDVSSFTAFAWPLSATASAFTPPQVIPVGENTAVANDAQVNPFEDSEINQGQVGIALQGGAGFPGGANGDVMYWVAGKSFSGGF